MVLSGLLKGTEQEAIKKTKILFRHKSFMYFSAGKKKLVPFEYFIARKILKNEVQGKKVSRPIVRISVISIALAVVVNLITIAVVTGFQREVRNKVSGFGSHIFIMNSSGGSIYECDPILKNQAFYSELKNDPDLMNVHAVAYKPVIFQSEKIERYFKKRGKDTSYVRQEIHGAIFKGVDSTYDWSFIKEHIISGSTPNYSTKDPNQEIVISSKIAQNLNLKIGDEVKAFFVKSQPVKRVFKLVGIYKTGLDEFDSKIAFSDIRFVQQLNDWGIQSSISIDDTLYNGQLIVRANAIGGNGNYRYDWGMGFENSPGFTICPVKDTTIRLITSDYWSDLRGKNESTSIPDTAYLKISLKGTGMSVCDFQTDSQGSITRNYLNESGTLFSIKASQKELNFEQLDGPGSYQHYVGGFEVNVNNWNDLPEIHQRLKKKIEFIPSEANESFSVKSIIENENDIFVWLGFLDLNVLIILTLMIMIGIINMGSALLVMILVRSNFIGMMKAMGATNWMIRKVFLIQAGFLILRGIIIGNIVGIGLIALQHYFHVLKLNPDVYYLDRVPIELDLWAWLALNGGTLLVCLTALIIPSYAITRINPVKAIKFN
jgi:lipoprotein-releasing system permease protein